MLYSGTILIILAFMITSFPVRPFLLQLNNNHLFCACMDLQTFENSRNKIKMFCKSKIRIKTQ